MPRPLRASCDRCHAQKLKCPKEFGSASCSRCLKAGSNCVFSPAGPAWRRSGNIACQSNPLLQQNLHGGDDLHLTWPPIFDIGDLPVANIDYVSPPISDPPLDTTPQDPRSACVRQLSAIAVEIHDVSVELSPAASIHLSKGADFEEYYSQHVIHVSHSRCIEQLFTLAQRLIDLYPDALRLLTDGSRPHWGEDCQDLNCFHNSDMLEEFTNVFSETNPTRSPIDMFLLQLLAACHEGVSDALDYIVGATKFCAKITAASPDLIQPRLHIPELRVGNFVASATSASSMQATLFSHITAVLMGNAKLLRKTVGDTLKETDSPDKKARMMMLQCELLEERSQLQAEQFVRIRDGLTKCAYLIK
ncbi:hypothetical protein FHL15_007602 [Xylaria flabelliformis]|uniref:Zn(2)-C6 fungal-type domain-containing protein n=1 Tax=Xylaria flabelliformis TaxID=2512241 RepID=A0A553HUJ4_9PEZI|nr:hypothetical protein FHL15_007602 [Xylaria flabelliformis]